MDAPVGRGSAVRVGRAATEATDALGRYPGSGFRRPTQVLRDPSEHAVHEPSRILGGELLGRAHRLVDRDGDRDAALMQQLVGRRREGSCGRATPSAPPASPSACAPSVRSSSSRCAHTPSTRSRVNGWLVRPAASHSARTARPSAPRDVRLVQDLDRRPARLPAARAWDLLDPLDVGPERVSTFTRSPSSTNRGTWTTAPVSSVAGFSAFVRVSPFTAGCVFVIESTTEAASSSEIGTPWWTATLPWNPRTGSPRLRRRPRPAPGAARTTPDP